MAKKKRKRFKKRAREIKNRGREIECFIQVTNSKTFYSSLSTICCTRSHFHSIYYFLLLLIIWCLYLHSRNKVVSCVAPMYIPLVGQCVCDVCSPVCHKNTQEVHFSQGSNSNVQGKRGQLCALAAPVIEYSLQTRTRQSFNFSKA